MRDQRLWTWHLGTALVILVLLGLHMTVMHLADVVRLFNPVSADPIAWGNVIARGRSLFFLASYVVLLGAALFHGFYGLRNIVFEMNPGAGTKRALDRVLVAAGIVLFAVGTWAAWTSFGAARGAGPLA
jgi:succinate dehydrogenase / fumarate reductase membrane anchor subunit